MCHEVCQEECQDSFEVAENTELDFAFIDSDPDVSELMARLKELEIDRIIEDVPEKLSPREIQVFELYLEEYSLKQISNMLYIEYGNVTTVFMRARKKIRAYIELILDKETIGDLLKN